MNFENIITPTTIGKRKRLLRILGRSGKGIIVPLDDNLISQDNVGLYLLRNKIQEIESANPNGILCYQGTATLISSLATPLIINITASTVHSHHTRKVLISSVQQALALDAAAVAVHINISSDYEGEMLSNLGIVSEICNSCGMPLFVISYPRKESENGDENYLKLKDEHSAEYAKLVSHCVRVAFELGADAIKTQYTGTPESFAEVVQAANGRPLFIAGGSYCEEDVLYKNVAGAMSAGASGVSIGRNIFNRSNSADIIENIRKIVFGSN